jgi:hypothetical protein
VTFGLAASFEEAATARLDERTQIIPFLEALTRFTADQHEVRMFYFHPTGIHLYENALAAWTAQARALGGRFHWYTMAALSGFLDRREAAQWSLTRRGEDDRVEAESPNSLKELTWLVPADRYARPRVVEGTAEVGRDGADWTVTAAESRRLVIDLARSDLESPDSTTETQPAKSPIRHAGASRPRRHLNTMPVRKR